MALVGGKIQIRTIYHLQKSTGGPFNMQRKAMVKISRIVLYNFSKSPETISQIYLYI